MKTIAPTQKKYSRRAKVCFWLVGALAAYTILGFFVAPAVVKAQMLKRLPPCSKGRSLSARSRSTRSPSRRPSARLPSMRPMAPLSPAGTRLRPPGLLLLLAGWAVREISLTHPFAQIRRARDGTRNFDDILAALAAPAPAPAAPKPGKSALPLLMIDILHIDGADVSLDDSLPPRPVHTKLLPVHLTLENLSTAPGAHNPYTFTAASDTGESFQWSGAFTLDPVQVSGSFAIKELDLKKYSPYLAPFVLADVVDGRLDVASDYTAGLATNGPELSLSKMEVLLRDLSVKSTLTGETVATNSLISLSLAEADLGKRLIHITSSPPPTVRCSFGGKRTAKSISFPCWSPPL